VVTVARRPRADALQVGAGTGLGEGEPGASRTRRELGLFEVNEAAEIVHNAAHQDANLIFGAVIDETYGERVTVTVIATGFDQRLANQRRAERPAAEPREEEAAPTGPAQEGDVLDIPAFLRRR